MNNINNINNINNLNDSREHSLQSNFAQLAEFNNIFGNAKSIELILEEWSNYKLLNKTDNLIDESSKLIGNLNELIFEANKLLIEVNKLLLEVSTLVNVSKDTINIYYNIGDFISNNILFFFYIIIICSILAICIQKIICIFLYFIYKDNKNIKIQRNNKNKKQNYITYFI